MLLLARKALLWQPLLKELLSRCLVRTHLDSGSPLTLGLKRHLLAVRLLRGIVRSLPCGWLQLLVLLVEMMMLLLHLMLWRLRILPVGGRRP